MRRIEGSTAFKRDYRRVKAISSCRDLDERLVAVLELLVDDRPIPARNRDHALSGNRSGYLRCCGSSG
jgi:mRNA interferase YafQ